MLSSRIPTWPASFRAHNEWLDGGHSRTIIQGFYGAGQEDASRSKPFILEGDKPPVLLGGNAGANAVEAILHAWRPAWL